MQPEEPAQPQTPATPSELPPAAQLQNLLMGKMLTQMIGVVAQLGIADLLKGGPRTVDELAAESKCQPKALYRVLRGLASLGVFTEVSPHLFALTPMASSLCSDAPDSLRDFAIFFSSDYHNRIWMDLAYGVKTGKSAAEHALGMKDFTYFEQHPEEAAIFNNAMTSLSRQSAPVVAQAYDFSNFETIVDVGGGHGFLLAEILKAYPSLRGVLYDLPNVVSGAGPILEEAGVADRCEVIGGSFFDGVPKGADAYIMKAVIHDWGDDAAEKILANCRASMRSGGRVLVVDMVLPPGNAPHPGKLIDIERLAVTPGGFERTAEEFRILFKAAGLKMTWMLPTKSLLTIIEGQVG